MPDRTKLNAANAFFSHLSQPEADEQAWLGVVHDLVSLGSSAPLMTFDLTQGRCILAGLPDLMDFVRWSASQSRVFRIECSIVRYLEFASENGRLFV